MKLPILNPKKLSSNTFSYLRCYFQNSKYTMMQVCRLSDDAIVPTRGTSHSVGFDLYSVSDVNILPRSQVLIPTDISIVLPKGTYGRIAPRYGLAVKYCIDVGAGVIDPDYTGNIHVLLFNFDSKNVFRVSKGDRIAQLILEKYFEATIEEVSIIPDTERGSAGFGSTW